MKHIKILGLLAVAAMAITAFIGTATASAETAGSFSAGKVGAKLETKTLVQHVFKVTGQEVICNKITFAGSTEALSSPSQKVKPTYEECTAGGLTATVNTAGCEYEFTATTTKDDPQVKEPKTTETHAPVHLKNCTNGGVIIQVSIPFIAKCKILVKNQTVADAIHYENTTLAGGQTVIDVAVTAKAVHAEVTESSGACPLTVGTHANATYDGKSEVKAEGTSISHTKE